MGFAEGFLCRFPGFFVPFSIPLPNKTDEHAFDLWSLARAKTGRKKGR
jgi:hypothetical protein